MSSAPSWTTFRALGTYVHLQTTGDLVRAHQRCGEILAAVDEACSRFRPDSDLSRANAAAGTWTEVSPLLVAAVQVAVAVARETDGIIDPGLGRNLIELGYDADFGEVRRRPDSRAVSRALPGCGAWAQINIGDGAIRVPRGIALDLGATAKAWASDLVAQSLFEETGAAVLVSLGGDISIAGPEGAPRAWPIEITEHPEGRSETVEPARITLDRGGLATSSSQVRRWRAGGVEQHHLIDPRTGLPARSPWRTVTATGPTCVAANAASAAALILAEDAVGWLADRGVAARLVAEDGSTHQVGQWPGPMTTGESCSPR